MPLEPLCVIRYERGGIAQWVKGDF
jgi:hypothetical protein